MKQMRKNNFGPLWPSDEQYHWNGFPKPTVFHENTSGWIIWKQSVKNHSHFWCIVRYFEILLTEVHRHTSGLKNPLPGSRTHFRSRKPTSSTSFSNARKYSHLKKKLITEFDSLAKIKILYSYLRWVIIVLSQKIPKIL